MWSWEHARRWGFEGIFALASVALVVPLWWVEHPPIQDLPQHLAAVRVLADYGDPDLAFQQYFTVDLLRTQYLAYYLAAILLSWPFGVVVANKLLITASLLGTPYAMRALLRAQGSDERVALFVLPLSWNAHLILGFLNFTAAVPLALWALALALRLRADFTRSRAVGLALLTLLCFYTHVVPFAFLGLGAALIGLDRRDPTGTLRRWVPLIPGALATLVWTQLSPAGESTVSAAAGGGARGRAVFQGPLDALREAPNWLTDVLHDDVDGIMLIAFVIALWVAALSGRARGASRAADPRPPPIAGRLSLALLAPLAAALYFLTPVSYDWIWPINARFPWLSLLFAVAALPRPRGAFGGLALTAALALALGSSWAVTRAFDRFETREVGALEEAIEQMPAGARVAGLIWDRGSREVKFSPFIHSAAWVQARNGGAVMFTFADFPQSPFVFREDRRPPRVPPRWEWTPERVDPATDLSWYDYVLVRGGPGRIASAGQPFERIWSRGRWSVWRHRR